MSRHGVRVLLATLGFACTVAARAEAQTPPAAPETFAIGDWQLAPTLELRARGEYRRNPVDLGGREGAGGTTVSPQVEDAGQAIERSRLGIGATHGALKAQLTLQDARAWGALSPSAGLGVAPNGFAVFGPYEAYAEAHTAGARPTFLRIGRQAIQWGEGRLLGVSDWSPSGRAFDAARAHLSVDDFEFELLAAILSSSRPLGAPFGDTLGPTQGGSQLYGAQAAWLFDPLFKVQLFGFAKVSRDASTVGGARSFANARADGETYTAAARLFGEGRGWAWGVEGGYQLGQVSGLASGGLDRAAYAVSGSVQYTFDWLLLSPTLRLAGAFASGDDGAGKYKQFDPLFPDVHTFHGMMDIFAWSNLEEGSARVSVVPWTDTTISAEYRYARLHEASGEWLNAYLGSVGAAPGNTEAELGHELDLWVTWLPWAPLQIVAGYSGFLAGDGARTILVAQGRGGLQADGTIAPANLAHLGYLQATLRIP